jgi:hypothetical protein
MGKPEPQVEVRHLVDKPKDFGGLLLFYIELAGESQLSMGTNMTKQYGPGFSQQAISGRIKPPDKVVPRAIEVTKLRKVAEYLGRRLEARAAMLDGKKVNAASVLATPGHCGSSGRSGGPSTVPGGRPRLRGESPR